MTLRARYKWHLTQWNFWKSQTLRQVHKVYSQKTRREQTRRTNPSGSQLDGSLADVSTWPCYRCGGKHAANAFKFKIEKCHHCSKLGHIAHVCRNRSKTMRTQYVEQEHKQEDEANDCENELFGVYSVYTATDGSDGIGIVLDIEGSSFQMQLDTGATVTSFRKYIQRGLDTSATATMQFDINHFHWRCHSFDGP